MEMVKEECVGTIPMKWGNAYGVYMMISNNLRENESNLKTAKKKDKERIEEQIKYYKTFLQVWFPDGEPKDKTKEMIEPPYKD